MSDYYQPAGTPNQIASQDTEHKDNNPVRPKATEIKDDNITKQDISPPPPPPKRQAQSDDTSKKDSQDHSENQNKSTTSPTDQQTKKASAKDKPGQTSPSEKKNNDSPVDEARDAKPEDTYNVFIEALLVDLGFTDLSEPEKTKLEEAIRRRVEARALRALMESLTDKQREDLDKETKEKGLDGEAIIKIMTERAPNASDAVLNALDQLYSEMKEETKMLWQAAAGKAVADSTIDNKGEKQTATPKQQEEQSKTHKD